MVGNTSPTAADTRIDHPTKLDNGASVLTPIKSNATVTVGNAMIPPTDDAKQRKTNKAWTIEQRRYALLAISQFSIGRPSEAYSERRGTHRKPR